MTNKKILIIESEKEFALSLAAVLGGTGHQFSFLEKGKQALEEVAAVVPHLIILRAELPDISGFTVCSQLRKSKGFSDTPVLVMSSDASEEAIQKHRQGRYPASDYLLMPFDMAEFRQKVIGFVGEGAPPAEAGEADQAPAGEPPERDGAARPAGEGPATDEAAQWPRDAAESIETLDDSAIIETLDQPPGPPPLEGGHPAAVSDADLDFVKGAFASIKSVREELHESGGRHEERKKGKKKPAGGLEEKLEFLRDKLKQREVEIARLADIWEQKEKEFSAFNEKLMEKEVEIQGLKMRVEDLDRQLEEAHRESEQQKREFKASIDALLEEKVIGENDLIQVVAGKEKHINDLQLELAQAHRQREDLDKNLRDKLRAGEEQYALLGEKLQGIIQDAGHREEQLKATISGLEESLESAKDDLAKTRRALEELGREKDQQEKELREQLERSEERGLQLEENLRILGEEKARSEQVLGEGLSAQMERAGRLESELEKLGQTRE